MRTVKDYVNSLRKQIDDLKKAPMVYGGDSLRMYITKTNNSSDASGVITAGTYDGFTFNRAFSTVTFVPNDPTKPCVSSIRYIYKINNSDCNTPDLTFPKTLALWVFRGGRSNPHKWRFIFQRSTAGDTVYLKVWVHASQRGTLVFS